MHVYVQTLGLVGLDLCRVIDQQTSLASDG